MGKELDSYYLFWLFKLTNFSLKKFVILTYLAKMLYHNDNTVVRVKYKVLQHVRKLWNVKQLLKTSIVLEACLRRIMRPSLFSGTPDKERLEFLIVVSAFCFNW